MSLHSISTISALKWISYVLAISLFDCRLSRWLVNDSEVWDFLIELVVITILGQAMATVIGTAVFELLKNSVRRREQSGDHINDQFTNENSTLNGETTVEKSRRFIYFVVGSIGSTAGNFFAASLFILLPFVFLIMTAMTIITAVDATEIMAGIFGVSALIPSEAMDSDLAAVVSILLALPGSQLIFWLLLGIIAVIPLILFVILIDIFEVILQDWRLPASIYSSMRTAFDRLPQWNVNIPLKSRVEVAEFFSEFVIGTPQTDDLSQPFERNFANDGLSDSQGYWTKIFDNLRRFFFWFLNMIKVFFRSIVYQLKRIRWLALFSTIFFWIVFVFSPRLMQLSIGFFRTAVPFALGILLDAVINITRIVFAIFRQWGRAFFLIISSRLVSFALIFVVGVLLIQLSLTVGVRSSISDILELSGEFAQGLDYVAEVSDQLDKMDYQYPEYPKAITYIESLVSSRDSDTSIAEEDSELYQLLQQGENINWSLIKILDGSSEDILYSGRIFAIVNQKIASFHTNASEWFLYTWIPFVLLSTGFLFLTDALVLRYLYLVRPLNPISGNIDKRWWPVTIVIIILLILLFLF